jgi:hypothetical protein
MRYRLFQALEWLFSVLTSFGGIFSHAGEKSLFGALLEAIGATRT